MNGKTQVPPLESIANRCFWMKNMNAARCNESFGKGKPLQKKDSKMKFLARSDAFNGSLDWWNKFVFADKWIRVSTNADYIAEKRKWPVG